MRDGPMINTSDVQQERQLEGVFEGGSSELAQRFAARARDGARSGRTASRGVVRFLNDLAYAVMAITALVLIGVPVMIARRLRRFR